MRAWFCRRLGHRWVQKTHVVTFYSCKRCGEPGFWVAS